MSDARSQDREWLLAQLATVATFLEDADARVTGDSLRRQIDAQRVQVREGRYRVVVLGAFNVGKSTLLNALIGGEYLPSVLEECTAKIVQIQPSDSVSIRVNLGVPARREEIELLQACLLATCVGLEVASTHLRIKPAGQAASAVRAVLEPLITANADERYPKLATLREKIDEVVLSLPDSTLGDEIILVDSPGVHSISETRERIAYEIIPRSQLVLCLVDSENAGNVHDLRFIEKIIKLRKRKVFFLLNKCDQLVEEEMDIEGRRGPARSLRLSLRSIIDDPELFFVSSYYALRAEQLRRGELQPVDIDEDNRIRIPRRIKAETAAEMAAYLHEQSRFGAVRKRLTDYLFHENKDVAVLEDAGAFLATTCANLAAPLETELAMARHPAKLAQLERDRGGLEKKLGELAGLMDAAINAYNAKAAGGRVDGESFEGLEALVSRRFTEGAIASAIINPIILKLGVDQYLIDGKKTEFKNLASDIKDALDSYISSVLDELNREAGAFEEHAQRRILEILTAVHDLRGRIAAPESAPVGEIRAGVGTQYAVWSLGGGIGTAAAGAALGAVLTSWSGPGAVIGAGIGAVVGLIGGTVIMFVRSDSVWRDKLGKQTREQVMNVLVHGVKGPKGERIAPALEVLSKCARERRISFVARMQRAVDGAISELGAQIADLLARKGEIERNRDAIIARLEPKTQALKDIEAGALLRCTRGGTA